MGTDDPIAGQQHEPGVRAVVLPGHLDRARPRTGGHPLVEVLVHEPGHRADVVEADRPNLGPLLGCRCHRHRFTASFARRGIAVRGLLSSDSIADSSSGRSSGPTVLRAWRKSPGPVVPRSLVYDAAVAGSAQGSEHAPVIGAERARRSHHRALHDLLEDRLGLDVLLVQLGLVEAPPRAVAHPVAADPHPGGGQLADAARVQERGLAEAAGDDEEGRVELAIDQCRQRLLDVRGVAVVERDPHVLAAGDGVQQRHEPVVGHPHVLLARIERSRRLADAVERQVDRSLLHHRINGLAGAPLSRRRRIPEWAQRQKKLGRPGVSARKEGIDDPPRMSGQANGIGRSA